MLRASYTPSPRRSSATPTPRGLGGASKSSALNTHRRVSSARSTKTSTPRGHGDKVVRKPPPAAAPEEHLNINTDNLLNIGGATKRARAQDFFMKPADDWTVLFSNFLVEFYKTGFKTTIMYIFSICLYIQSNKACMLFLFIFTNFVNSCITG